MLGRLANLLLLEIPIKGLSSRPRIWWAHTFNGRDVLLTVLILCLVPLLFQDITDMVYMTYFSISIVLCYKSNKRLSKVTCEVLLLSLILLGTLQYFSFVPNFWQGNDVITKYATGLSSEPSFFALSLYWLIILSQNRLSKILIYCTIVFLITGSYTIIFLFLAYVLLPNKFYKASPLIVFVYVLLIINSSFSFGTLTLVLTGSWREIATESLLVENLFNIGGSIKDAVWSGQRIISGNYLPWIDTSYSLISVLSMWSTYLAFLVFTIFINKASSKKELHFVFIGFLIVPKWMIFYLLIKPSNDSSIRS